MNATLKKSGTFVAFAWFGKLLDPRDQAFADALANRRFRSIDTAASEEVSAGWVTPADPTGNSFALEDMDAGPGTWLRVRIDTKKLPKAQVQMHLAAAARAQGKPLTARQRRELKDDLAEKLLPRVIPTTTNVDALLYHDRRLVLLFAGGKSARETFGKLFAESFGVELQPLGPLAMALQSVETPDVETVERMEPTRWPVGRRNS
ncbi:MAG: recombination-associated protein RdgC [Planctomycetes bacterium]|nr:recombination-associated protein RdgC [Planctomycetota bacterium]